MSRPLFPVVLVLLLLGLVALWWAHEEWEDHEHEEVYPSQQDPKTEVEQGRERFSLQEIVRSLQLPEGSRILEVEREEHNGRLYYEIELLMPDGRVQEMYVDPRTAEVIGMEEEDEEAHETSAGGG